MQELIDKINELNKQIETLTHERDKAKKEEEKLYRELWNIDKEFQGYDIAIMVRKEKHGMYSYKCRSPKHGYGEEHYTTRNLLEYLPTAVFDAMYQIRKEQEETEDGN